MSLSWVLLYAWNPLVLKEIINSVHLDGLVALWLLVAVLGFVRFQGSGRPGWACFSGVALGLATLSKLYPVILLPAGYFFLRRSARNRSLNAEVFVLALTAAGGPGTGALSMGWMGAFDRRSGYLRRTVDHE